MRAELRYEALASKVARKSVEERVQARLLTTLTKVRAQDWQEAREKYETLLEIFPNDDSNWDDLALTHMQLGEYQAALDAFLETRSSLQDGVQKVRPTYYLAWAYSELGQIEKGFDVLEGALANGFPDIDLLDYDRKLEGYRTHPGYSALVEGVRENTKLKRLAEQAGSAYYAGDFARAVRGHQAALQLDPQDAERVHWLGRCLLNDNRVREALTVFQRQVSMEYYPDYANSYVACCQARVGHIDGAFEFLERALEHGWSKGDIRQASDLESLHSDPRWAQYQAR